MAVFHRVCLKPATVKETASLADSNISKHVVFIVNVVVCFSDDNSFRSTYTRLYV